MATENLKELLKEGVTLDEQNVGQLTEMFEQAIVAERIKLTESKDAEIAALNEQHAKALEDATVMANARIDEAIDVAVDKFIAESEDRFVQADEYARMKALFEAVKTVFEQNAFALNENAAADQAAALLKEHREDYDALFERHMSLKDENAALALELETAKRAIIFEKATADLTDTQRERVGALVENVEFDTTDEFVTGLKLIVEMEKKKDDEDGKGKGKDDGDDDEDDEDKALKEQAAAAEAAAKAAKTGKLHEMDFNARMSRYKA